MPLLLLGLLLPASAQRIFAKDAPASKAPLVWNGRDRAREVKAWIKEYFGADDERRAAIRAALDELGILKPSAVKTQAKAILKAARKTGPRLTKKSTQAFVHDGLKGVVHVMGAKKKKAGGRRR